MYINDVRPVLDAEVVDHFVYADDLQAYLHMSRDQILNGISRMSRVAAKVAEWADSVALKLITSKTKAITFGTSTNINSLPPLPVLELRGTPIPFMDTVVNLGVILDSKLTWNPQVESVTKKVNRALYSLRFFRHCTTIELRKQLVSALAISHLDYCSVVYLDVTEELKQKIQRLQNSCARYVFGIRRDDHITPYRRKLGWLKTDTRCEYFSAIIIYKALRIGQPSYLAELFSRHNRSRPVRGDPRELDIPPVRLETGRRSLRFLGASRWNSLPSAIRNKASLCGFKRALYKYLFNRDSIGSTN